jgi:MFS family permease
MFNDGGLPDYIADHFRYLVRCSKPARFAQLAFFGLGLVLPPVAAFLAPSLADHPWRWPTPILIVLGFIFAASFLWYVSWIHERRLKFREEMPNSYARWFGIRRHGPFGGMHPGPNLRLVKMQLKYLVLEQEPSAAETLALSMDFARHTAA